VRVSADCSADRHRGPLVCGILSWAVVGVRLIVCGELVTIAFHGHGAITVVVVAHGGSVRAVDRNLVIVGANSVAMGVRVVQKSTLEHLVV